MRVLETCGSTLPQVNEPKEFTTEEIATIPIISPKKGYLSIVGCTERFRRPRSTSSSFEETEGFEEIQVHSLLDQEMAEMSPVE